MFNPNIVKSQQHECGEIDLDFDSLSMSMPECPYQNCAFNYDDLIEIFGVNENTPVKYIRIKFFIIQYSANDPRNFDLSNPDHVFYLDSVVSYNEAKFRNFISTSDTMCLLQYCVEKGEFHNIQDAKIRFETEYVEVVDSILWNADLDSNYLAYWLNLRESLLTEEDNTSVSYFLGGSQCLHDKRVLLIDTDCNLPWGMPNIGAAGGTSFFDFENHTTAITASWYSRYIANSNGYFCDEHPEDCCDVCPYTYPFANGGMAHEMGHVFSLGHTIDSLRPDSTRTRTFPYCMENIMNPNGDAPRRYLNTAQIAQIHRAFSKSSLRYSVVNCESSVLNHEINSDQEWVYNMKMYQNILVIALIH